MPLLLIFLASAATLFAGAVAAVAARIQGGSRGVLGFVIAPVIGMIAACAVVGGYAGALVGLTAALFATGAYAGGFSARPLLVRLRLATPQARFASWS